jgi:L-amino acid N-acyltransferase YncA
MTFAPLRIRPADVGDAAAIAAIYAPFVERTAVSFESIPPGADEMADRIGNTLPNHPWLVAEFDDRIAGYAYATRHAVRAAYRWSVDTSVYIDPAFHRRGVGRALYTTLLGILRAQGFFNAYAGIALPNPGSVGLHEAVGFRPLVIYAKVGYKHGAWHDVGWWEMALRPHCDEPPEPVPFSTFVESPAWTQGALSRT